MDLWRLIIASVVAPSVAVALLRLWAKRLELRHIDQKSDHDVGKEIRDELRAELARERAEGDRIRDELLACMDRASEGEERSEKLYQQLLQKDARILELEEKLRTRPPDAFNSERAG